MLRYNLLCDHMNGYILEMYQEVSEIWMLPYCANAAVVPFFLCVTIINRLEPNTYKT